MPIESDRQDLTSKTHSTSLYKSTYIIREVSFHTSDGKSTRDRSCVSRKKEEKSREKEKKIQKYFIIKYITHKIFYEKYLQNTIDIYGLILKWFVKPYCVFSEYPLERVSMRYFLVAFIAQEIRALRKTINFKCTLINARFISIETFYCSVVRSLCWMIRLEILCYITPHTKLTHRSYIPYSPLSLCLPHDLVNRTGTGNEASYPIFRFVLFGVCPANARLARANEFRYGKFYSCLRLYRHVLTLAMSKYSLVRMKCNWPRLVCETTTNITPTRLMLLWTKHALS